MANLKTIRKRIASVKSDAEDHARHEDGRGRAPEPRPAAHPRAAPVRGEDARRSLAEVDARPARPTAEDVEVTRDRRIRSSRGAPEKSVLLLVITSDRGLCGAFNTNIIKAAEREWREREAKRAEGAARVDRPQGPRLLHQRRKAPLFRRTSPASGRSSTWSRRGVVARKVLAPVRDAARSTRSTSSTTSSRAR